MGSSTVSQRQAYSALMASSLCDLRELTSSSWISVLLLVSESISELNLADPPSALKQY